MSQPNTPASSPPPPPAALAATNGPPDPPVAIRFLDLKERNAAEFRRLQDRRASLLAERKRRNDVLPPELAAELTDIESKILDPNGKELPTSARVLDPVFLKVRDTLGEIAACSPIGDHKDGKLPSQQGYSPHGLAPHEKTLIGVYGRLEERNQLDPTHSRFASELSEALANYTEFNELYEAVLDVLVREGATAAARGAAGTTAAAAARQPAEAQVRANEVAAVVKALRDDGVVHTSEHLPLRVRMVLAGQVHTTESTPPSMLNIDLPDLEGQANLEIVTDNIQAMQAIYFAAMLEDLRLFQVVDKLLELFQSGMLPLGRGPAGNILYGYWKKSVNRMSEVERRNLYGRAFGFPGGDEGATVPNRDFHELFLRFVSAVSGFTRQFQVDALLRSAIPLTVSQEQIRKSGRDLAANLSLHGYGMAWFAATDLQNEINEIIGLLGSDEIKQAYGARDMWQVIEQVSTLELGGVRNSVRYRTMATAGAIIIRWLANRSRRLSAGAGTPVLDLDEIRNPPPRPPGQKPTTAPNDRDLVDACEQWLAVTGTPDQRVEEYSQPIEGPNVTSGPIRIPRAAQDLLDQLGVPMMSAYSGGGKGGSSGGGYGGRFANDGGGGTQRPGQQGRQAQGPPSRMANR